MNDIPQLSIEEAGHAERAALRTEISNLRAINQDLRALTSLLLSHLLRHAGALATVRTHLQHAQRANRDIENATAHLAETGAVIERAQGAVGEAKREGFVRSLADRLRGAAPQEAASA